jgi:hypothetical protein
MTGKMKFRKNEKVFIVACLVLFFFLGIFLFLDVSRTSEILAGDRERVGAILFIHNDVSRNIPSGAAWEGLRQGSPVLDNDTIITGFDSSAGIALKDGSRIDICEDSIVTFGRSGDDMKIIIEKGCADVKRSGKGIAENRKLAIIADNKKIMLREGELSIAKPAGKDPEMFVRKGEARVSVNGDQRTIGADDLAVLKPDSVSVEKKKLVLVDPSENQQYITSRDARQVEFAWDYKGEKKRKTLFMVDISKNRAFSPADKHIESPGEMTAASLTEGDYFWRVSVNNPENGTRETSETRRFAVSRDDPFALVSPSDGEVVEYNNRPPLIIFTWQPHRLAGSYVLELSEKSDFSDVLKKIDSRVVNFSFQWDKGMKPGERRTLYWRVTATGGPRSWRGRKSESSRFIVKRGDRLMPPRLVYPVDGKNMTRSRVGKEHVIFSWEKTEDTLKRRISFSKDNNFSSIYREMPVDADHWAMKQSFPAGSYFWRVGLYDAGGNRKAVSGSRRFELRDYEELALLYPEDRFGFTVDEIEKNGLPFSWKKPDLRGRFILELSNDKDFKKVNRTVTTESLKTTIDGVPPGNFYWRVKLLHDDNTVAAASGTRSFTIHEGMAPPAAVFPRAGGAVKMLTENELKFSWKPTRGADAYQLELHQLVREKDKTRDKLVLSTETDNAAYTVSDLNLLDVGNFYWTVRAVKKDRHNKVVRSSKKIRNNFNINLGESKIIIVSPEIQVIENDKGK